MPRFTIDGVEYLSTKDAAELLGVAPNTLRAYIKKGVLEDVPFQRVGTRKQRGFTMEWVEQSRATLIRVADEGGA